MRVGRCELSPPHMGQKYVSAPVDYYICPFQGIVDRPILGHHIIPPCYFYLLKWSLLVAITNPHTLLPRTSPCEYILVNILLMSIRLYSCVYAGPHASRSPPPLHDADR